MIVDKDIYDWIHEEPILPHRRATKQELEEWIEEQTRLIGKVRHMLLDFMVASLLQIKEKVSDDDKPKFPFPRD